MIPLPWTHAGQLLTVIHNLVNTFLGYFLRFFEGEAGRSDHLTAHESRCDYGTCIMPLLWPNVNSSTKRSGRRYVSPSPHRLSTPCPLHRAAMNFL
jgi:hypothetical protein